MAAPVQMSMAASPEEELKLHQEVQLMPEFCEFNAEGFHCMAEEEVKRDVQDVPVEELRPCFAACCNICSLFCGCPSCIGCAGQCTLVFCMCKCAFCKLLDCKDDEKKCCIIDNCNWYMSKPNKLYECTGQYCCLDIRGAFPCTTKVPCLSTCFGISCCADFKCKCAACKKVGELIPRLNERVGKSSTSA